MLKAVKASLAFMTPKERAKWVFLASLRAFLSILDLAGILAIGFVVTSTAIFLTQGSATGRVLDFAGFQIPAVTAQTLPLVAAAILATFLLKAFLSILVTKRAAFLVATIEARSAKVIAQKVFGSDLAEARLWSREEMAYAIQFGSPAAFNYLLNSASTVIAESSLVLLICLGFLLIDPTATLAAVAYFAGLALLIQYFIGTLMEKAGAAAATGTVEANSAVSDLISVFRELSVFGLRHKFIDKIYSARISTANSQAKILYLGAMPRYIVESALLIGVAAFILVQLLTDDIVSSAAIVGVFLSGGFRLTAAMLPLQSALLNLSGVLIPASKAHEILTQASPEATSVLSRTPEEGKSNRSGSVEAIGVRMSSVTFRYSTADDAAVQGVSLQIRPGEQVAFIGPSGSGKSTIADLMCGILTPSFGEISLTNESPGSADLSRRIISYVPQKPGLVSGTVSQNVALGVDSNELDSGAVWEALESAHLGDVIRRLPNGIETDLGKYQDGLSGGQVQRLGLARALYHKPGLLVMDEATSALDAESEAEIAKALEQMRGKVTIVLIAHRLNTVQHADRVFLINDGKLADQGTFPDLLSRNPSIERLVQLMKVQES
jgi:ATP-binding cassette subfamily C protein